MDPPVRSAKRLSRVVEGAGLEQRHGATAAPELVRPVHLQDLLGFLGEIAREAI